MKRAATGEYVGQADGNIFRIEHLADQFQVSGTEVLQAADDLDNITIVAGVLLPS